MFDASGEVANRPPKWAWFEITSVIVSAIQSLSPQRISTSPGRLRSASSQIAATG